MISTMVAEQKPASSAGVKTERPLLFLFSFISCHVITSHNLQRAGAPKMGSHLLTDALEFIVMNTMSTMGLPLGRVLRALLSLPASLFLLTGNRKILKPSRSHWDPDPNQRQPTHF